MEESRGVKGHVGWYERRPEDERRVQLDVVLWVETWKLFDEKVDQDHVG